MNWALKEEEFAMWRNGRYVKNVPPGTLSSKCTEAEELDWKGHRCYREWEEPEGAVGWGLMIASVGRDGQDDGWTLVYADPGKVPGTETRPL